MGTQSWTNTSTMKTFLAVSCILIIPCLIQGALDGVVKFNINDIKSNTQKEVNCTNYMVYVKPCSDVAESLPFFNDVNKEYGEDTSYLHSLLQDQETRDVTGCVVWG